MAAQLHRRKPRRPRSDPAGGLSRPRRAGVGGVVSQINALLGWTISRNLYLECNYAHFFAGAFLADTGPSDDVDYAGMTLAFRF